MRQSATNRGLHKTNVLSYALILFRFVLTDSRFIVVDIFHWGCLDQYAREFPPTTAPAGYRCPACKSGIFPPNNLIGPVVNVLREKLSGVNWARNGLGLPLVSCCVKFASRCFNSKPLLSAFWRSWNKTHFIINVHNAKFTRRIYCTRCRRTNSF